MSVLSGEPISDAEKGVGSYARPNGFDEGARACSAGMVSEI